MTDASLVHLLARVAVVEARVNRAVQARQRDDPQPHDPFRGLYVSDDAVLRLLSGTRAPLRPDTLEEARIEQAEHDADRAAANGAEIRVRGLVEAFALTDLEVEVLLVALAPDLDTRFEWMYGYLNDDVTRRRATVGLALSLCGVPPAAADARAAFRADSALVGGGLVVIEDDERPLLSRTLRVPDRVASHLLGDDRVDPALTEVLLAAPPSDGRADPRLAAAVDGPPRLVYVRERPGGGGAAAAVHAARRGALLLDLAALRRGAGAAQVAVREARLTGRVLVGAGVDALGADTPALRVLADAPSVVVLVGTAIWDPSWAVRQPLQLDVAPPTARERSVLWRTALDGRSVVGLDPAAATTQFVLTPEQVVRAAESARMHAELGGAAVTDEDLRRGARAQNSAGLERLARRIEPAVGWDDLVLPPAVLQQLQEVALRARRRTTVLDEWHMRPGGGRGRGITALFAGDSGTGKTMSAEVIAADLGLDLYTVNLATVISKWIGETEKNLESIFVAAAGVNAVLLFDEADALFGRRSEVRDAHDRYANIESAYLLQRMESFDGLAILATNLRANLDEAFTRRLDVVVNYSPPDASMRRRLWDRCLGPHLPRGTDLDLEFCADSFELSGGNIRSAVVSAAYRAAAAEREVRMADLVAGVHREYRKLGRLTVAAEFGRYHSQLS